MRVLIGEQVRDMKTCDHGAKTVYALCFLSMVSVLWTGLVYANQAPYLEFIEDQRVRAGDFVSFDVKPVDEDGVVPGVFANSLPDGAEFVDNGNGTRNFRWQTRSTDAGQHVVLFVTVDAIDSSLRHSQQITIDIEAQAAEEQGNADSGGNTEPWIEDIVDQRVAVNEFFSIQVKPRDPDGVVPGLIALSLPDGAQFVDNYDGTRSFRWTPNQQQTGEHTLVFVAIDAVNPELRGRLEVLVVVEAPAEVAPVTNPNPPVASDGNRAPYFQNLDDQRVSLGDTLEFVVAPVDDDGQVPGMFANTLPYNAVLIDNFNGTRTLRWRPYPVQRGEHWITFTAIDALDDSLRGTQSVKISVEDNGGYNFEPVINGINNPVIRAGDTLQQRVQPVDPDGDVPKLEVLNPPAGSEFVDNGDGTRTLRWPTSQAQITEFDGVDNPHVVVFRATDARDPQMTDEHELKISVVAPESLQRSGRRLRELADSAGIAIGYASVLKAFELADTQLYNDIAAQEFNIVTPENSHKWGWIHPRRGEFRFEDADLLADFAEQKGMVLHGHPLIWHRQLPQWVKDLQPWEARPAMMEHINALVSRYKGRVKIWDVINEALEEDGSFRNSVWFEAMGDSYIADAFRLSRQLDPAAKLIYNDYDVAWHNPKSDAMYEMLRRELQNGTPIDGVGFQMHFWASFDDDASVESNLQRFADLGLDIYITELDVAMADPQQLEMQASVYQRIVRICRAQPRCKAIQTWGFTDRYSWRYAFKPLLLTERYQAKPAYYAVQQALQ